ncbi:MAG: hypothetical protein GX456_10990 [Verrucomicrobia bacterium]|nr:hypothetical protein [Verrucomicrobiota bacterium]
MADDEEDKIAQRLPELGLSSFAEPIFTYYSDGARAHAMRIATNMARMRDYYQKRLGIQTRVALAVLNSNDWSRLDASVAPYGMSFIRGTPPTVFMPAQGGMIFDGIVKGLKSFTPEQQAFLRERRMTFEAIAEIWADRIAAFHELGHIVLNDYGIDPRCLWLHEFLATYFGEEFTANEQGDWTITREFPKKPPSSSPPKRPKHTTLADFEKLYSRVDDYGWYQAQFLTQAQEVQSKLGLKFLKEVKRLFPANSENSAAEGTPLTPEESLTRLEDISPGFKKWAEVFRENKPIEK